MYRMRGGGEEEVYKMHRPWRGDSPFGPRILCVLGNGDSAAGLLLKVPAFVPFEKGGPTGLLSGVGTYVFGNDAELLLAEGTNVFGRGDSTELLFTAGMTVLGEALLFGVGTTQVLGKGDSTVPVFGEGTYVFGNGDSAVPVLEVRMQVLGKGDSVISLFGVGT
jgi:hypothetical protein